MQGRERCSSKAKVHSAALLASQVGVKVGSLEVLGA